jgi:hypothetical protein
MGHHLSAPHQVIDWRLQAIAVRFVQVVSDVDARQALSAKKERVSKFFVEDDGGEPIGVRIH